MMPLLIYGVNSSGKHQIFGFGFVNDEYDELINYEFIMRHFAMYMEKPPKIVMMSR